MRRSEWASDFLEHCGFSTSAENHVALVAWMESERSHNLPPNGAHWNPLDTTEPWNNASNFNSAGVKNYANEGDGLDATKATLFNGRYGRVVSAFKLSNNANAICQAVSQSPWGSHPADPLVNAVRANPAAYDVEIAPSTTPAPAPPQGQAPPFPLPLGDWFGLPNPNLPRNHSGYYSASDRANLLPWQERMHARGWAINTDGYYSPTTYRVTVAFQREKGLPIDGHVGPQTWGAAWTAPVT